MVRSRASRLALCALCVCVALAMPVPVAVGRVSVLAAPTSTIVLSPPAPNGLAGWFTTAPEVSVMSSADGTACVTWNGGAPQYVPVLAGTPQYVGDAPEGPLTVAVSSEDASSSRGATVTTSLKVDSVAPSVPNPVSAVCGPGVVTLTWGDSVEAGSGLLGYRVYRKTTQMPFAPGDLVASVTATSWADLAPPVADLVYYSVTAHDVAGWESVLSTAVATTPDSSAPSTPGDLRAWLNSSGWVRIWWTPSIDVGSGLREYQVLRSLDGGPFTQIGIAGDGATLYDDHDDQVLLASTVRYELVAVDRVGNLSSPAGPTWMLTDVVAPTAPSGLSVTPVYSGTRTPAQFDVRWTPGADGQSGLAATELQWGALSGLPDHSQVVTGTSVRVTASSPTALLHFRMRTLDRAGNLSATGWSVSSRNVASERFCGTARIQTAIAASKGSFASAQTVVIASAGSYPDALCGVGLAGAVYAPVLLVGPGPLPAETRAELVRLGARNAYVVGGTGAVSAQTLASLDGALSGSVQRVAGIDRYATAAAVARRMHDLAGGVASDMVFVVSGEGFADALSVGPVAWTRKAPVLYATRSAVSSVTTSAIADIGATRRVIVGGTSAVTTAAESILPGAERVAGTDRYATNREFGQWAVANWFASPNEPVIATGNAYPDGLVGGAVAGSRRSLLLLVSDARVPAVGAWLAQYRGTLNVMTILGGTAAVSETARTALWQAVSIP